MKQLFITILALFTIAMVGHAQPAELFSRTWKVEKQVNVLGAATTTLFHKDSVSNIFNYATLKYNFFNNGTYTVTSDSTSSQGTWAINSTGDSVIIDTIPFLMTELSATRFTTRGYTIKMVDAAGTLDSSFSYVTLYPLTALPVNLLSFTGQYANNLVTLNWSTAQEQQNKAFEVQYSADGYAFETIGSVPGKINSNLVSQYLFNTTHYRDGKNFYRLKQVDQDGHSTISSIVTIQINQQGVISLAPNPASTRLNLSVNQPVSGRLQLTLTTLTGQQVWATRVAGNSSNITVNLPALTKGVYVVAITNSKGEKLFTNKLVIQ
ncbi:MAG: T9SS type A sorting domain-containing protein [Niastella sp.]|uniref:T9SS type A sorting domain-containing protein n=1 Tax=Niastella sp. TaxID=1869183 RepID=UPI003899D2B6